MSGNRSFSAGGGSISIGSGGVQVSTPNGKIVIPGCFRGPTCTITGVSPAGSFAVGTPGQTCNFSLKQFPEVTIPGLNATNVDVQQGPGGVIITVNSDVLFAFNQSAVQPAAAAQLNQIAKVIKARWPGRPLQLRGNTDSIGSATYNKALSLRRANAVKAWLVTHNGFGAGTITTVGLGSADPIAPNTKPNGSDNPAGRALNRRVEIVVATR